MGYVVRSYKREEFRDLKGREATLRVFGVGRRMLEGEYLGRIGYGVGGGGEEGEEEEEEEGKGRGEGEGDGDEGEERCDDDEGLVVQKGGEFQGEKKRWGGEREREMGSKRRRLLRRDERIVPPLGLEENGRRMRPQSSSCLLPSCGDSTTLEQPQQQQHCIDEQVGKSQDLSRKMVVYEPVVNDPLNKKNKKKKKKIPPPPSPSHIDSKLQHHLHLLRATISDFSRFLIQTTPPTKSSAGQLQHLLRLTDQQQPLPLANQDFSSNLKTLYRNIFQNNNGLWRDAFEDFVGVKKKKEEEKEEEMNKEKRKKNQGKTRQEITPPTIIQAMIWTFLEMEVFDGFVLPLSAPAPAPAPPEPALRRLFSLSETANHHNTRNFDASTPFVERLWRILMEHFTFFFSSSSSSSSSFPSTTILPPTPPQQLQTIHTQALLLRAEMSKKVPSTMMISSEKFSSSSSFSSYYRLFKHSRGSIVYCRRCVTADDGHHYHHHLDKNKNKKNNIPSEDEERDIETVAFTIAPGIERVSSSSSSSSSSPSSSSGEKTTVVIEPPVIALLGRSGDG